jgi:hypothetical protein
MMELSENILLQKAKIEVLENDIRVLKEEIAAERGERIKRTGYVIVSEPEKDFWGWRSYITNVDILRTEKNHGQHELYTLGATHIRPDNDDWIQSIIVFKTKNVAEYILSKIKKDWTDRWHVYDMRQLKEIMNEQPYINSKASKVL